MRFPSCPNTSNDIWNFRGNAEYLACAMAGNRTARQLCAFRKLRIALGDQTFREILCDALDVMSASTSIQSPAGWLYAFVKDELVK